MFFRFLITIQAFESRNDEKIAFFHLEKVYCDIFKNVAFNTITMNYRSFLKNARQQY